MTVAKIFIAYFFVTTIFLGFLNVRNFNRSKAPSDYESLNFTIPDDKEKYEAFIASMRALLTNSCSHGIPILKPQPASPETPATMSWLDIRLTANDNDVPRRITVRIEQSNLYVYGYARNDETKFWEFMPEPNKTLVIPQSQSLGFYGSYTGLESTAGQGRLEIPLGVQPLRNVVFGLVRIDKPNVGANRTAAARHLIILIQMLSEAARFKTMSTFISDNWWNPQPITNRLLASENYWRKLSTAVQFTPSNATNNTLLPNISSDSPAGVSTLKDAVDAIGIMLLKKQSLFHHGIHI